MAGAATPATRVLAKAGVEHVVIRYDHDPSSHAFGDEAVDALVAEIGAEAAQVFKTLVVELSGGDIPVAPLAQMTFPVAPLAQPSWQSRSCPYRGGCR